MRAKYPIYVSADRSRAVRRDDSDAKILLVPAGHDIPAPVARRYGLVAGGLPEPVKPKRKKTARKKTAKPVEDEG